MRHLLVDWESLVDVERARRQRAVCADLGQLATDVEAMVINNRSDKFHFDLNGRPCHNGAVECHVRKDCEVLAPVRQLSALQRLGGTIGPC